MNGSRKDEPVADIFSRWSVISRSERIEGIAYAVDVVEKLADLATPGFCAGERVVRHKIQAPGRVPLQMQCKRLVT